jgi:hypothetical protein
MLLALVFLSPVVQPWYLIWGLGLLACEPAMLAWRACLILAAISPFTCLPGGWQLEHAVRTASPLLITAMTGVLILFAVVPLGTRAPMPGWMTNARREAR